MAVSSDLINLVLDDYYSKKENKKHESSSKSQNNNGKEAHDKSPRVKSNGSSTKYDHGDYSKGLLDVSMSYKGSKANKKYEDFKQDSFKPQHHAYYSHYPGTEYKSTYNLYDEYIEPFGIYPPPIVRPLLRPHLHPGFPRPVEPYSSSYSPRPPPYSQPPAAHFGNHFENQDRQMKRKYDDIERNTDHKRKYIDFSYIKELFNHDKLPKELTDQFTRSTCHLCLVTISTPGLMELHYRGKNHLKRLKGWLYKHKTDYKIRNSDIAHLDQLNLPCSMLEDEQEEIEISMEEQDPQFCKLCNVPLSSSVVAKQHYSGKKHQKAVFQRGSQDNAGHVTGQNESKSEEISKENKWYCHICKVTSTNEEQYEIHLSGKRHKKTWKEYQVVPPIDLQSIALASHQTIPNEDAEFLADTISSDYDLTLFCPECKEYFPSRPEHTYHTCSKKSVNPTTNFCKKCKTTFDTLPELKYHDCVQDHYCEKCNQYFDEPTSLPEHTCNEQDLKAKQKSTHEEVSLQESSYFCTLCRKDLNSPLALESHGKGKLHRVLLFKLKDIHGVSLGFNPFRTLPRVPNHCDKCNINFRDEDELKVHMKRGEHMNARDQTTLPGYSVAKDKTTLLVSTKPPAPVLGSYDIRNLDVNALLNDYYKKK